MVRALVVDDDIHVAAAIRSILERHDCETVISTRAHAGIHAFRRGTFDLVIIDLFLPGMSGLDVISAIRRESQGVPILAVSGFRLRPSDNPDTDFLELATQRGATWCLRKPFSPNHLFDAIRKCFPGDQIQRGIQHVAG